MTSCILTKRKLPREKTVFMYLQGMSQFVSNFMFEPDEIQDLSKLKTTGDSQEKTSCLCCPLSSSELAALEWLSDSLALWLSPPLALSLSPNH